jgi:Dynein heavy chain, N-terminal region 1
MGVNGPLFEIIRLRGGGSQLAVNFDPQVFTLFWKVKNLLWLNFQVPHTVSVIETLKAYGQTLDLVENNKGELSIGMRFNRWYLVSRGEYIVHEIRIQNQIIFLILR